MTGYLRTERRGRRCRGRHDGETEAACRLTGAFGRHMVVFLVFAGMVSGGNECPPGWKRVKDTCFAPARPTRDFAPGGSCQPDDCEGVHAACADDHGHVADKAEMAAWAASASGAPGRVGWTSTRGGAGRGERSKVWTVTWPGGVGNWSDDGCCGKPQRFFVCAKAVATTPLEFLADVLVDVRSVGLRETASAAGFDLGAVLDDAESDGGYFARAAAQFTSVSPRRCGWDGDEDGPEEESLSATSCRRIIEFARGTGQSVIAGPLVSNKIMPLYVERRSYVARYAGEELHHHVAMTVTDGGRQVEGGGGVAAWIVVANALRDDASGMPAPGKWADALPGYVERAFEAAAEARDGLSNPPIQGNGGANGGRGDGSKEKHPLLLYHQSNAALGPAADGTFTTVRFWKRGGVAIDGVSLSLHVDPTVPLEVQRLVDNLQRYGEEGLRVRLTHVDVACGSPCDAAATKRQASLYAQVVYACLRVPACDGVTVSGVDDAHLRRGDISHSPRAGEVAVGGGAGAGVVGGAESRSANDEREASSASGTKHEGDATSDANQTLESSLSTVSPRVLVRGRGNGTVQSNRTAASRVNAVPVAPGPPPPPQPTLFDANGKVKPAAKAIQSLLSTHRRHKAAGGDQDGNSGTGVTFSVSQGGERIDLATSAIADRHAPPLDFRVDMMEGASSLPSGARDVALESEYGVVGVPPDDMDGLRGGGNLSGRLTFAAGTDDQWVTGYRVVFSTSPLAAGVMDDLPIVTQLGKDDTLGGSKEQHGGRRRYACDFLDLHVPAGATHMLVLTETTGLAPVPPPVAVDLRRGLRTPVRDELRPEEVRQRMAIPIVVFSASASDPSGKSTEALASRLRDVVPGHPIVRNLALPKPAVDAAADVVATSPPRASPSHQLKRLCAMLASDNELRRGFNAVGWSRGAVLLRAYVEKCNDPPIRTLISIAGPHNGVLDSQSLDPEEIAPGVVAEFGTTPPRPSAFFKPTEWREPGSGYFSHSAFLADINNEGTRNNRRYARNVASLRDLVLVRLANDTVVLPGSSQHFGWVGADGRAEVGLESTDGYANDAVGLRALNMRGSLHRHFLSCGRDALARGECLDALMDESLKPFLSDPALEPVQDDDNREAYRDSVWSFEHLGKRTRAHAATRGGEGGLKKPRRTVGPGRLPRYQEDKAVYDFRRAVDMAAFRRDAAAAAADGLGAGRDGNFTFANATDVLSANSSVRS